MRRQGGHVLQSARREGGFSLIEILIALGILAIGLVSVFALFGAATSTHHRGVDHTSVSLLALTALSEAKETLAGDQLPKNVKGQKHPGFPDLYAYDITYEAVPGTKTEFKVTVTVRWMRGGEEQAEPFETILTRQQKVK